MTAAPPEILRPGILTADMISAATDGDVVYDDSLLSGGQDADGPCPDGPDGSGGPDGGGGGSAPKSPGMKYRHYAPAAEMLVVEGRRDKVEAEVERLKKLNESIGNSVGVMLFEEQAYIEAARDFYATLRSLDAEGVDLILAGALSDKDGVGFAVMNRMMKSAGYNIAKV
jgi:L-threonylcarbamoyladenylate synthase